MATARAPRPNTSDLYDRIGQLETRVGEIERMVHRQSYHSDRYAGILKHLAGHYGVTLLGTYDPLSDYEQQQQDDQVSIIIQTTIHLQSKCSLKEEDLEEFQDLE
ncbi:hypothetical protein Tco_1373434 [Tanacetum coccineum]